MGGLDVPDELHGLSGLYNSQDPLLRRLRLEDPTGKAILDVERYFKDAEVLVLYAGSDQGSHNLAELHKSLTGLALKHIKVAAVLYVSTDTDPECQKRITKDVPWLRMTFNDNSDFAPLVSVRDEHKIVEVEDVERGEDFVQAGELEIGAERVELGVEEYQHDYVRPLSRAAVTVLMRAYSTPSIAVYHIPTHTFAGRHINKNAVFPQNLDKNMQLWRKGTSQSIQFMEILIGLRWFLFMLVLAVAYRLLVLYGGEQYNVVPNLIDKLRWQ